jgi:hypothetical protein
VRWEALSFLTDVKPKPLQRATELEAAMTLLIFLLPLALQPQ